MLRQKYFTVGIIYYRNNILKNNLKKNMVLNFGQS